MWKYIKRLFKQEITPEEKDLIKSVDNWNWKEEQTKRYNEQKLVWEKANEMAKKQDACNLGMTKTAFDGTYEEYVNAESKNSLAKLQSYPMSASYLAQMQAAQNGQNGYSFGLGCGRGGFFG